MKIAGKKIQGACRDVLVIPRPPTRGAEIKDEEGTVTGYEEISNDIVFEAEAVLDFSEFEKVCPTPKPPVSMKPGGAQFLNFEDPDYRKKIDEYGTRRTNWLILKSLSVTPGLEWERVHMGDPTTWHLFIEELKEAGLNTMEATRVQGLALTVNSIDEQKMEEAKSRFLATRRQEANK